MTSSILSRLEAELNMMIETRADIRIIEVRMSCSNYSQILREYADRLRYGIGSTSMTGDVTYSVHVNTRTSNG